MLIGAFGDVHLRWTTPALRIDDFAQAQINKLNEALGILAKLGVKIVLLPGDVFDMHTAPHGLVESVIPLFRGVAEKHHMHFFVVWGQHDQRYHTSEKKNTPLGVLVQALGPDIMTEATSTRHVFCDSTGCVAVYGASWGSDIPEPVNDKDCCDILIMHKQVMERPSGWEDENAILAERVSKQYPYTLVVAGDNHKQFSLVPNSEQEAIVVNAGSLMRQNIDQMTHKPAVYIYDTEKDSLYREELSFENAQDVFKSSTSDKSVESSDRLERFITSLQNRTVVTTNFKKNVTTALEATNLHQDTKNIIIEIMEGL